MDIIAPEYSLYETYDSWKDMIHPSYRDGINEGAYVVLMNLLDKCEQHECLDAGLSMHLFKHDEQCKLFGFSTFDREFKMRCVSEEEASRLLEVYWKKHKVMHFRC